MESQPAIRGAKKHTKRPGPKKKATCSSSRVDSLATPKHHNRKFEKPVESVQSGVSPKALTANASTRIQEMSLPPLRTLIVNKQIYSRLPTTYPDYANRLDKKIERSWNSMYNCYKRANREQGKNPSEISRKGSITVN